MAELLRSLAIDALAMLRSTFAPNPTGTCEDIHRDRCLAVTASGHCTNTLWSFQCPRSCGRCQSQPRVFIYANHALAREASNRRDSRQHVDSLPYAYDYRVESDAILLTVFGGLTHFAVRDPSQADLFIAFMTPAGPPYQNWSKADQQELLAMGAERESFSFMGNDQQLRLRKMCRALTNESGAFMQSLTHLNETTAHRHFVVPPMAHSICPQLLNERGVPASLSPAMSRLILELTPDDVAESSTRLNTLSLPYMSNVRWSRQHERGTIGGLPPWHRGRERSRIPPWRRGLGRPRKQLISFVGSTLGTPFAQRIRRHLADVCRNANSTCRLSHPPTTDHDSIRDALAEKRRSTFCLEPPGYGKVRRSLTDSFLMGCIPVLFMSDKVLARLLPAHIGSWRERATVAVSPEKLLDGRIDLLELLRGIQRIPGRIADMRATIAHNAHMLVYSLDDNLQQDAVRTLVQGLWQQRQGLWHLQLKCCKDGSGCELKRRVALRYDLTCQLCLESPWMCRLRIGDFPSLDNESLSSARKMGLCLFCENGMNVWNSTRQRI